jgi:hypothetical protein
MVRNQVCFWRFSDSRVGFCDVRFGGKSGMRHGDEAAQRTGVHRPSFLMQIGWPLGAKVQSQSGPKPLSLFGLEFGNQ